MQFSSKGNLRAPQPLERAGAAAVIWASQDAREPQAGPALARGRDGRSNGRPRRVVMLNKGLHAAEAVALRDRLMARMAEHQTKKTLRLRALEELVTGCRLRAVGPGG